MIQNKIKRNIKSLLLIIILFLFSNCSSIHNFDLFVASDDSLAPSIYTGDYFILNKSVNDYDYGDIIIYSHYSASTNESFNYLWRIAALPYDTILVKDDYYGINGELNIYHKTREAAVAYNNYFYDEYEEVLPNGKRNLIFYSNLLSFGEGEEFNIFIPKDYYYALCDLRSGSFDSRSTGPIGRKYIKGQVVKLIKEKNFFKVKWAFYKYALWGYKKESVEAI